MLTVGQSRSDVDMGKPSEIGIDNRGQRKAHSVAPEVMGTTMVFRDIGE